mmetsp:Transcript_12388/g.30279  ORF Transcript_12388/g.30279 Transcript_12388/m.30279 type:complete len:245 (+) Transcript_12388:1260-1994(+)
MQLGEHCCLRDGDADAHARDGGGSAEASARCGLGGHVAGGPPSAAGRAHSAHAPAYLRHRGRSSGECYTATHVRDSCWGVRGQRALYGPRITHRRRRVGRRRRLRFIVSRSDRQTPFQSHRRRVRTEESAVRELQRSIHRRRREPTVRRPHPFLCAGPRGPEGGVRQAAAVRIEPKPLRRQFLEVQAQLARGRCDVGHGPLHHRQQTVGSSERSTCGSVGGCGRHGTRGGGRPSIVEDHKRFER